MAEPGFSRVLALLPRNLQLRFQSLGAYVDQVLAEEDEVRPLKDPLSSEEKATIKLVIVGRRLERFFESTARAGEAAVRTLSTLGLEGFRVGSKRFAANSPDLKLGHELAAGLREAIGDSLFEYAGRTSSLASETRILRREVVRARALG